PSRLSLFNSLRPGGRLGLRRRQRGGDRPRHPRERGRGRRLRRVTADAPLCRRRFLLPRVGWSRDACRREGPMSKRGLGWLTVGLDSLLLVPGAHLAWERHRGRLWPP